MSTTKTSDLSSALAQTLAKDRDAALKLVPVSRETVERLDAFVALLLVWQARTNLIAPSTVPQLWTRHIADSLQLIGIGEPRGVWIDLGSGGGFPGVVIACALNSGAGEVILVERNARKAAFLREAIRVAGAPGRVQLGDIAEFVDSFSGRADYITARALAPLKLLLEWSAPLVRRGAKALFLKGQDVEAELTEAAKYWKFAHRLHPSATAIGSYIVEITELSGKSARPGRA